MTDHKRAEESKRDSRQAKKQAGKQKEFGRPDATSLAPVSWLDANAKNVLEMIDVVTRSDGAIMLTRSQDGGTLGVRVYHDDYKLKTYWARPGDELDTLVSDISGDIST